MAWLAAIRWHGENGHRHWLGLVNGAPVPALYTHRVNFIEGWVLQSTCRCATFDSICGRWGNEIWSPNKVGVGMDKLQAALSADIEPCSQMPCYWWKRREWPNPSMTTMVLQAVWAIVAMRGLGFRTWVAPVLNRGFFLVQKRNPQQIKDNKMGIRIIVRGWVLKMSPSQPQKSQPPFFHPNFSRYCQSISCFDFATRRTRNLNF